MAYGETEYQKAIGMATEGKAPLEIQDMSELSSLPLHRTGAKIEFYRGFTAACPKDTADVPRGRINAKRVPTKYPIPDNRRATQKK
ncbi:unnamed protein product [Euphydryas editha]|uniref:Uncharacterized protein n=1 Tax=Euphydryas editha TaxID=104508 RepID=A0AAU9V0F3_EUPED|nr:unnamed protein product [Euphydryas editha]